MKMPIGDIPAVVTEYFDAVLMPAAQASGGLWAFSIGFVGGVVTKRVPEMVSQYLPLMKSIGLVDEGNMLDVDLAYGEATSALKKAPLVIGGYRVDQSDLDTLRNIMNKYSK